MQTGRPAASEALDDLSHPQPSNIRTPSAALENCGRGLADFCGRRPELHPSNGSRLGFGRPNAAAEPSLSSSATRSRARLASTATLFLMSSSRSCHRLHALKVA
eukprot:scaffold388_cov244-Pinguiococcus_pyrenoidosus.AAC.12